jgi:di/tricarboxylate transporter
MLVIAGGLPLKDALAGYSSASAWLVLGAMLISRTLRDTGLSRRIALVSCGGSAARRSACRMR